MFVCSLDVASKEYASVVLEKNNYGSSSPAGEEENVLKVPISVVMHSTTAVAKRANQPVVLLYREFRKKNECLS